MANQRSGFGESKVGFGKSEIRVRRIEGWVRQIRDLGSANKGWGFGKSEVAVLNTRSLGTNTKVAHGSAHRSIRK